MFFGVSNMVRILKPPYLIKIILAHKINILFAGSNFKIVATRGAIENSVYLYRCSVECQVWCVWCSSEFVPLIEQY